jgi:hypothetical protein
VKLSGLLQPLSVPNQAWALVSLMDFIEGLPQSSNHSVILVVIDKFSKYTHFIPMAHPFIALQVAQLYFNQVYRLHGLPQAIISDRDRIFMSSLWQELFKLSDTQLIMSSSYHPQTDEQTERRICVVLCTCLLANSSIGGILVQHNISHNLGSFPLPGTIWPPSPSFQYF